MRGIMLVSLLLVGAAPAALQLPAHIDQLGWLAGCWASDGGESGSGEQWTAPAGGTMLGLARTVRGSQTVDFEFLRIAEVPDRGLELVAMPGGGAGVAFPLLSLESGAVAFENPGHDFPQRISYRAAAGDRLLARIEGLRDGRPVGFDFPMTRIACAEPQPDRRHRSDQTTEETAP